MTMRQSLLTTTLLAAVAITGPTAPSISTSVESKQMCITKFQALQDSVLYLPTKTRTSVQQIHSTVTACAKDSTTTVTITPTVLLDAANGLASSKISSTPTLSQIGCSLTRTTTTGVTTMYTGTYESTDAQHTANAVEVQRNFNVAPIAIHTFGNPLINLWQQRFAVDCIDQVTTYLVTTLVRSDVPKTATVSASPTTVYMTSGMSQSQNSKLRNNPITTTIFADQSDSATNGVCIATFAQHTTTQHVKCAPTNLISAIDGKGIGQTEGDPGNTRGLAPGGDPSACCQLCVDDENCAASEDDPDAGNCFLWYTTPACGLGFRYSDGGQGLAPGKGFLVQTGCGRVEGRVHQG